MAQPNFSVAAGRPPPLTNRIVADLVCKHFHFTKVEENSVKSLPSYQDRNYYFHGTNSFGVTSEYVLKLNSFLLKWCKN